MCEAQNTYRFNVGITKIFCTILGRDKVYETLSEKENVKIIMEKNFEFCKNTYQDFYKKELCYGEE